MVGGVLKTQLNIQKVAILIITTVVLMGTSRVNRKFVAPILFGFFGRESIIITSAIALTKPMMDVNEQNRKLSIELPEELGDPATAAIEVWSDYFSKALLQVANTTIKDKGKNTEREVYNISHEKWLKVSDSIDKGYYKKSKCTKATAPPSVCSKIVSFKSRIRKKLEAEYNFNFEASSNPDAVRADKIRKTAIKKYSEQAMALMLTGESPEKSVAMLVAHLTNQGQKLPRLGQAALVAHLKKQERTKVKVREKQLNDAIAIAKTLSPKQQDEVITLIAKLAKFK
jgi:hypothetical protein